MPTPSKFTAEVRKVILEALVEGHSHATAAQLAGVNPSQLSRWLKKGIEAGPGSQFRKFAEEAAMAEAAARGRALRILNAAMVDQPKWAAWFLERRDPVFAPPSAKTPPGSNRAPAVVVLSMDRGAISPALEGSTVIEVDEPYIGDAAS